MSNKLYLFTLIAALACASVDSYGHNAYDEESGNLIEIIDFDYDLRDYVTGQIIEYYDFEISSYQKAVIVDIEDNFSMVTIIVTDQHKNNRKFVVETNR